MAQISKIFELDFFGDIAGLKIESVLPGSLIMIKIIIPDSIQKMANKLAEVLQETKELIQSWCEENGFTLKIPQLHGDTLKVLVRI